MSSKPFRRKDLKHDEFITATGHVTHWLMGHRRRIGWALLAVAVVVSVVFGVQFAHQRQEQQAAVLLASAMEVYRAPVIPPAPEPVVTPVAGDDVGPAGDATGAPTSDGQDGTAATPEAAATTADPATDSATADGSQTTPPTGEGPLEEPAPQAPLVGLQFASAEDKYRAALERFEPIVERYGSRPSGRVAAFYVGDCYSQLGDSQAAIAAFARAAENQGTLVSAMALYRLGQLERGLGNADAAVGYFDRVLQAEGSLFPREEALMAKARAQAEAGDMRGALASYQRVLDDFADSYSALEARSQVEEISAQLGLDHDVQGN